MRPIKFRVWDKKEKKWYEPVYEAYNGKLHDLSISLGGQIQTRTLQQCADMKDWQDGRYDLMQYTGLKDKSGKEIYEGDIVRGVVEFPQLLTGDTDENSNFRMGGEVFWDYDRFSLRAIQGMCDPDRPGMVNYFDFVGRELETFDDMVVIGNIYESPELLK